MLARPPLLLRVEVGGDGVAVRHAALELERDKLHAQMQRMQASERALRSQMTVMAKQHTASLLRAEVGGREGVRRDVVEEARAELRRVRAQHAAAGASAQRKALMKLLARYHPDKNLVGTWIFEEITKVFTLELQRIDNAAG